MGCHSTGLAEASAPTVPAIAVSSRSPKDLIQATRPFARESRWRSWWFLTTTLSLILGMLVIAAIAPWWPLRLVASILGALTMVRGFILYHDYMHRAILRGSRPAAAIMHLLGMLLLAPARSWKATHNHHHAHVGKLAESAVGSYETMTVEQWRSCGFWERLRYRAERSPLIILFAYPVMFLCSITLLPFLRRPLKHWDSLPALLLHGGLISTIWWLGGFSMALFAILLPFILSSAMGAYLFYAQHNVPGVRLFTSEEWAYHRAALESCSFIRLGPVMRWFTADIGYHHIHHLNASIPFYRLKEAMREIPECRQPPVVTTLRPWDILTCLRLKLWDSKSGRMIGYREARSSA